MLKRSIGNPPRRARGSHHPSLGEPVKPSRAAIERTEHAPGGDGRSGSMDVDELVRTLYPPSRAEAILRLMLERLGEVVTYEDMAAAVFVDDPGLAHYDSTQAWGDAARHLVSDIRQRLHEADAPYEVDTIIRRGYRLVNRRAPRAKRR